MMSVEVFEYSDRLRSQGASFVTLHRAGELLGCIGTLRPHRALVADVAHNAYQAAFNDPRFPALTQAQLLGLDLHISVLTPLEPRAIESEEDLLAQLRPGIDGLVLEDGDLAATFLPTMWPRLQTAQRFVRVLKEKAQLPPDYWSATIRAYRYSTEEF
jgi:AmmeMemoRadiSam system protein A